MTVLTALTIQGNYPENISVLTGGKNGEFAGFIYLLRDGEIRRPLVSTTAIFKTKEEAENAMNDVVQECLNYKI